MPVFATFIRQLPARGESAPSHPPVRDRKDLALIAVSRIGRTVVVQHLGVDPIVFPAGSTSHSRRCRTTGVAGPACTLCSWCLTTRKGRRSCSRPCRPSFAAARDSAARRRARRRRRTPSHHHSGDSATLSPSRWRGDEDKITCSLRVTCRRSAYGNYSLGSCCRFHVAGSVPSSELVAFAPFDGAVGRPVPVGLLRPGEVRAPSCCRPCPALS